jgi:hypothetical protein
MVAMHIYQDGHACIQLQIHADGVRTSAETPSEPSQVHSYKTPNTDIPWSKLSSSTAQQGAQLPPKTAEEGESGERGRDKGGDDQSVNVGENNHHQNSAPDKAADGVPVPAKRGENGAIHEHLETRRISFLGTPQVPDFESIDGPEAQGPDWSLPNARRGPRVLTTVALNLDEFTISKSFYAQKPGTPVLAPANGSATASANANAVKVPSISGAGQNMADNNNYNHNNSSSNNHSSGSKIGAYNFGSNGSFNSSLDPGGVFSGNASTNASFRQASSGYAPPGTQKMDVASSVKDGVRSTVDSMNKEHRAGEQVAVDYAWGKRQVNGVSRGDDDRGAHAHHNDNNMAEGDEGDQDQKHVGAYVDNVLENMRLYIDQVVSPDGKQPAEALDWEDVKQMAPFTAVAARAYQGNDRDKELSFAVRHIHMY